MRERMRPWERMLRALASTSLFVLGLALPAVGQTSPNQITEFRFHLGDDANDRLGWADPKFDDSAWQQIDLRSPGSENLGFAQGVVWFRARIQRLSVSSDPALLIAPKATRCKIFVNGSRVTDCNQLPGPNYYIQRGILVRLPRNSPGPTLLLAVRLEHAAKTRSGAVGLGEGDVELGSFALLADHRAAKDAERFYSRLPQVLLCLGELLGGAVLLVAFSFDRSSREYLWFAAFLWIDGSASLMDCFDHVYPLISAGWQDFGNYFGLIARYAPLIGFLAAFTKRRLNWALRGYQILLLVLPEVLALALGNKPFQIFLFGRNLLLAIQLPFVVGSLVFLVLQWRRGNRDAMLLLPSFLLANGIEMLGLSGVMPGRFHLAARFQYDFDDLSMFFFLVSIAPVMIMRHRRITLEHAQASAELEAAREVQQQLVVPAVDFPGFRIESAYAPAKQVGGDFFRVLPEADGSVLIVVGDVSGKGLKAAMTVSAIMGALRGCDSHEPAEVLEYLNRVLFGQIGGFVTCCVALITTNGAMTIANAGNPAPYRNGEEMPVESGLPLGMIAEVAYIETRYQLDSGDRLTFVSDGVIEATSPTGELYGFERTQAISNQPAHTIAEAVKQFGQEDDITVLTLARLEAMA